MHDYLKVIGYWGNYIYFTIQKDYRNAAIQIYKCTSGYPLQSLFSFPIDFYDSFSYNTSVNISQLLKDVNESYNEINNYKEQLSEKEKGLMVGVGLGVASVAAIAALPFLLPMGVIAGIGVLKNAGELGKKLYQHYDDYQLQEIKPLRGTLIIRSTEFNNKMMLIKQECHTRLEYLQRK